MLVVAVVVGAVALSLVGGSLLGVSVEIPKKVMGFAVALSAGALITALVLDLMEPAIENTGLWPALLGMLGGAVLFTTIDVAVKRGSSDSDLGLIISVTSDGLPENLALGVTLIGAGLKEVSALAVAIILSNLPEAAGGAASMESDDRSRGRAVLLWTGTAALLSAAAILGYTTLGSISDSALGLIRALAAGAVVGSIALEVIPKGYQDAKELAGVATALGFAVTLALDHSAG